MRVICCLILLCLLVLPVSAGIYVSSGDTLYYGELADLTGVYGWECTVAWWSSGSMDDTQPDREEEVCDNSHNIEITEERFPAGNWYRWDGAVSKHENALAFIVATGHRPVIDLNQTNSTTAANVTLDMTTEIPTTIVTTIPTTEETPIPTIYITPRPTPVRIVTTPAPSIYPNIPPIPVFIGLLLLAGGVLYLWMEGRI